ncbi:extensin family protein [Yoonia sp.]|uniref:extensin-like domain-containing protein n=1 Tax=Yoonia sp. TaxID=2212373 RepID=UPI002369DAF0|nr:extensin family protein [Yoonia sp.]MDB4112013.1 extensin family protein [Yoonia sp.]
MRHAKRQQLAQHVANKTSNDVKRSWALVNGLAAFCFAGALTFIGYQFFVHPDTPLPQEWNPTQPLAINDPVTPLTAWKLDRAAANFDQCLETLAGHAIIERLAPIKESPQCFVSDRVTLRKIGEARVQPLETRCAIALCMAMWERHSLQPAAMALLGSRVADITQIGSYNCRTLRTTNGPSTRMSTHATADAIDISGFRMADGTAIRLIADWETSGPKAAFLRAVRDGACDWFSLTLSPDYNSLHADHFHLQSRGWGYCR